MGVRSLEHRNVPWPATPATVPLTSPPPSKSIYTFKCHTQPSPRSSRSHAAGCGAALARVVPDALHCLSNGWVLSVRLMRCALAHARGFVRRRKLRWAPHTRGTRLGGTAGQHTLTASAPPFVPTLDAAFTTVSTALSVLWRRTEPDGDEDKVSTLARKQRSSPTTRTNTPGPGSVTASTCFRHTRCRYWDIWFAGRAIYNA